MSTSSTGCITIELEPGEPIRGRLVNADGTVREFRGWLELCGAIEHARPQASAVAWPGPSNGGEDGQPC